MPNPAMTAATSPPPDALLLISSQCPHCTTVLDGLQSLLKQAKLGRLEVVNIDLHPEIAEAHGVRAVPWLRLGEFVLTGLRSAAELSQWAARSGSPAGMAEYFAELFEAGQITRVVELIQHHPAHAQTLLLLLGDPEAPLQVRLGAAAALEHFQDHETLRGLTPALAQLCRHADARIRADACHTLSLGGDPAARAILEDCLTDPDATVREIAAEGLTSLTAQ